MPRFSSDLQNEPKFFALEAVLRAHEEQVREFGGDPGIRDLGLLKSALAQPMATFGDQFLHEDLFAMAAAYVFHIVKNHPFVDGNKRTGLATGLAFLDAHGIKVVRTLALYDMTIAVAEGKLDKIGIAEILRRLAKKA